MVEKIHVEGTGFDIIKIEGDECFVALGKYRLTTARSEEECREMISSKDWEIILGLIGAALSATEADVTTLKKEVEKKLETYNMGEAVEMTRNM